MSPTLLEQVSITHVALLMAALSFVSPAYAKRPMEGLAMYGGEHNPEVEPNKDYSQSAAKLGWDYFYKGEPDIAMKRFNQAWMFDRDSVDALWGFGVVMGARAAQEDPEHHLRESVRFLEMAHSKSSKNDRIMVDLAYSCTLLGSFLNSVQLSAEGSRYLAQARKLFEQCEKIDATYPLLYSNWSVLEFSGGSRQLKNYLLRPTGVK